MLDSLQLDTELLTVLQSDPQYDYDRELIGGSENLLEWLQRVIKEWFSEYLNMVLEDDVVTYVLIGVGIIVLLFLALLYWRLRPKLFVRGGNEEDIAYDVQEDTIYGINFDAEIAKALRVNDYRQAMRLVYLQTLLHLQNASLIDWQPSKTPVQYMRQMNHPAFTTMSQHFMRVRYGNFEASKELFEEMQTLKSQISNLQPPTSNLQPND